MSSAVMSDSSNINTSLDFALPAVTNPVKQQTPFQKYRPAYPVPTLVTQATPDQLRIIHVRNVPIVLDCDLAPILGTTVDALNKIVMRNAWHFPYSACFRLTNREWHQIRSLASIEDKDRGNWLCAPLAFTRDGIATVSRLLGSGLSDNYKINRRVTQ